MSQPSHALQNVVRGTACCKCKLQPSGLELVHVLHACMALNRLDRCITKDGSLTRQPALAGSSIHVHCIMLQTTQQVSQALKPIR
jgi:hypothetical protein